MAEIKKIEAKKSLGQHFLTSPVVPGWMCEAADLRPGDIVLEIGPGTGVLTKELLGRGATVVAVETDTRAITALEETFADEIKEQRLLLIEGDVRTLALDTLPQIVAGSYKVVANIPYYLSGFLFRTILESNTQPSDLVYLVQKEVAKRGTEGISSGEKESLLSLSLQAYGTPTYVKTVSRGHFMPPPKVDSAIIAVRNISKAHFAELDEALFFALLHQGFGQKRKQLLGNLAKQHDRAALIHIFSTIGLAETVRAEDVSLQEWLKLAKLLSPHS